MSHKFVPSSWPTEKAKGDRHHTYRCFFDALRSVGEKSSKAKKGSMYRTPDRVSKICSSLNEWSETLVISLDNLEANNIFKVERVLNLEKWHLQTFGRSHLIAIVARLLPDYHVWLIQATTRMMLESCNKALHNQSLRVDNINVGGHYRTHCCWFLVVLLKVKWNPEIRFE